MADLDARYVVVAHYDSNDGTRCVAPIFNPTDMKKAIDAALVVDLLFPRRVQTDGCGARVYAFREGGPGVVMPYGLNMFEYGREDQSWHPEIFRRTRVNGKWVDKSFDQAAEKFYEEIMQE